VGPALTLAGFAAAAAAVAGGLCWALARAGWRGAALALVAALAVASVAVWGVARGRDGFDALALFILVPMLLAPGALGGLLGQWLGARARRRG
jgi:hypothetical protein